MKRLVWRGAEGLVLEHLPGPAAQPKENEVLLRMRAVGICGTDIHILKGAHPASHPPLVLGHEMAAEIAAVGKNVGNVREGDRVTVDSVVGCGRCPLCRRGSTQFCVAGFEFGITRDGGCQDYLIAPKRNVYRIPDAISFEEAAVLDMEVYRAASKCGVETGDTVLILGAGPIGLIACQITSILGAGRVSLGDVLRSRLDAAEALGMADEYLAIPEAGFAEAGSEFDGKFDVVMDCAGTAASTKQAFGAARPGGRVLLYGVHERPVHDVDMNHIVLKDLTVFGAQSDRNGWEEVIGLVTQGRLNLKKLITHTFPLEEGPRAFDLVRRREGGVIKAVLLV